MGSRDGESRQSTIATAVLRASIASRCRQAGMTLAAVALNAIFTLALLYRGLDARWLWLASIASTALLCARYHVAMHARRRLAWASRAALERFDLDFRRVSVAAQIVNGAAIWIGWSPNIFDDPHDGISACLLTLMICLYATGTMVHLSQDYRSFRLTAPLLMGQPIVFWLLVGAEGIAIATILAGLTALMISSVRNSQRVIEETVRIRFEKDDLLELVAREKEIALDALRQAESANRSKTFFMAAAAHDVCQPLCAATLLAETLALHPLPPETASLLAKQTRALAAASGLFDNLLDLSRFESGAITPVLVDVPLADLLRDIEAEFAIPCRAKGLALTLEVPECTVESDYLLLDRMIRNLVGNSVRYTKQGGVHIRCEVDDDAIRLVIADTGIGIAPEDQDRIFREYVQIQDPSRERGKGVGLGLAIVRHIARLLDHPVTVESRRGDGTRMSIRLRAAHHAASSRIANPEPAAVDLRGRRVWIVEDDSGVRDALCDYFTTRGCECATAHTRGQLEELWRSALSRPDYVLVDDLLGAHESGLELAGWLSARVSPARILMMTASKDRARRRTLESSAFKVRSKPILTPILNDWLSQVESPSR